MAPRGRPFAKGHKKLGGRTKGTPNLVTDLRASALNALNRLGGEDYLADVARRNKNAFMSFLGKVIPREFVLQDRVVLEIVDYTGKGPSRITDSVSSSGVRSRETVFQDGSTSTEVVK